MVFLVGQEFEEFPGKFSSEVINIGSCDGFKISKYDTSDSYNIYAITPSGLERFMFNADSTGDCVEGISSVMRLHVNNEPTAIIRMEECDTDEEINDKDMVLDIMFDLLKKYGHEEIVNKYIDLEQQEIQQDINNLSEMIEKSDVIDTSQN